MMQMQTQQVAAMKAVHDKDMQFFKLQMDVKNAKSTGDKVMGVLVNPNLPQVIASFSAAFSGQPTAQVGRLATNGVVPRQKTAQSDQATAHNDADTEGAAETETAFDPQTLSEQQRELYEKGLRINTLMQQIQARFPDSDPLDMLENGVGAIVTMDETALNELMMKSFLTN